MDVDRHRYPTAPVDCDERRRLVAPLSIFSTATAAAGHDAGNPLLQSARARCVWPSRAQSAQLPSTRSCCSADQTLTNISSDSLISVESRIAADGRRPLQVRGQRRSASTSFRSGHGGGGGPCVSPVGRSAGRQKSIVLRKQT